MGTIEALSPFFLKGKTNSKPKKKKKINLKKRMEFFFENGLSEGNRGPVLLVSGAFSPLPPLPQS